MPEQVIVETIPTNAGSVAGEVLVADTSVTLLPHNDSRGAFVVSADTADVWLWYGAGPALVGKGVRVKAGGNPWREESWKGAVQAISHGAAVVGVTELDLNVGDVEGEEPTGATSFIPEGPSDNYSAEATQSAEDDPAPPGTSWPPQT